MAYRVATSPTGERLWWTDAETIPPDHTAVRPATAEEASLMNRIMAHDASGRTPPLALGDRLARLLDADDAGR